MEEADRAAVDTVADQVQVPAADLAAAISTEVDGIRGPAHGGREDDPPEDRDLDGAGVTDQAGRAHDGAAAGAAIPFG